MNHTAITTGAQRTSRERKGGGAPRPRTADEPRVDTQRQADGLAAVAPQLTLLRDALAERDERSRIARARRRDGRLRGRTARLTLTRWVTSTTGIA